MNRVRCWRVQDYGPDGSYLWKERVRPLLVSSLPMIPVFTASCSCEVPLFFFCVCSLLKFFRQLFPLRWAPSSSLFRFACRFRSSLVGIACMLPLPCRESPFFFPPFLLQGANFLLIASYIMKMHSWASFRVVQRQLKDIAFFLIIWFCFFERLFL